MERLLLGGGVLRLSTRLAFDLLLHALDACCQGGTPPPSQLILKELRRRHRVIRELSLCAPVLPLASSWRPRSVGIFPTAFIDARGWEGLICSGVEMDATGSTDIMISDRDKEAKKMG